MKLFNLHEKDYLIIDKGIALQMRNTEEKEREFFSFLEGNIIQILIKNNYYNSNSVCVFPE